MKKQTAAKRQAATPKAKPKKSQPVSKRADIALCRKCGVTFGWDRQAEAERAVRSGKHQKSIAVS